HDELAEHITAGEGRDEACPGATSADGLRRDDQLLRVRIVEGGELRGQHALHRGREGSPRRYQTALRVDGIGPLSTRRRGRAGEILAARRRDLLRPECARRYGMLELEVAYRDQSCSHRRDEVVVHLPVADESAVPARGRDHERAEDDARATAQRSPKRTDCGSDGGSVPSTRMLTGTAPAQTMPIAA